MSNVSDPSGSFYAVTPSDSTDVSGVRALYIGGAGNVVAMPLDSRQSTAVTFTAVPVGTILPIQARRIMAATTATLIVALG